MAMSYSLCCPSTVLSTLPCIYIYAYLVNELNHLSVSKSIIVYVISQNSWLQGLKTYLKSFKQKGNLLGQMTGVASKV